MDQHHATSQARRCSDFLLVEIQHVIGLARLQATHQLRETQLVAVLDDRVGAIDLRRGLGGLAQHVAAAIAVVVVPVHLDAVLRNREWVVAGLRKVAQAVAIVDQLGRDRTFFRKVVDLLGRGARTLGLVHRDPVAVGVALEHGHLARGQLVLVLRGIGRGNHELWLVAGKRIAQKAVIQWRRTGLEPAGPGRDAAVGVAGFLGAQWRQGGAQLGRFLFRYSRHHTGSQQRQGQCANAQHGNSFHCCIPLPGCIRSSHRH
ncbi:hypothetical protein D3C76_946450 [compost metagenome]